MKILGIETATEQCSVAWWDGASMIERCELAGQRHSERILAMVADVLKEARSTVADLDVIAFGEGPGSFTGLRVACGVAQGLALGSGLPVVGVSTLMAIAAGTAESRVIVATDARMGEIYHAAFERDEKHWAVVSAPRVCTADSAPRLPGGGWHGCGNGFSVYDKALAERYGNTISSFAPNAMPAAASIARLGALQFQSGIFSDPERAAPTYIRDKVALKAHER